MQSVSSRIWTRVAVSISYNDKPQAPPLKKKNCRIVDFAVLANHREKIKENETRDLARELKKAIEHESDCEINHNL